MLFKTCALKPLARVGLVLSLVLGSGCNRHRTRVLGFVASSGGVLGVWRSQPSGCSRAPFDGLPVGQSKSVVTFLWQDQTFMAPMRQMHNDPGTVQVPVRLELARSGTSYVASLATAKTNAATRLDEHVCSMLRLDSRQTAKAIPEGKPTLAGHLDMDCEVNGGHLTASLEFAGCSY